MDGSVQDTKFVRHYGAVMLSSQRSDWGSVRATVIRRERMDAVQQRFRLPWHVFRLSISGTFKRGSTTRLESFAPRPLAQRPGRIAFYPAGTIILNEVTGASRVTYLTVEVDPALAHRLLQDDGGTADLSPMIDSNEQLSLALLRSLADVVGASAAPQQLFAEHAALMLLLAAARAGPNSGKRFASPRKGGLGTAQLARVTDYIIDCFAQEISLQELSSLAGLSVTHLCRSFKESTGTTPHRWQLSVRISRAQQLLTDPCIPLAHIALAVGFAGQSQFTTAYRRETGITPGAWRRENQK